MKVADDDLVLPSLWHRFASLEDTLPELWEVSDELVAAFRHRRRGVAGALSSRKSVVIEEKTNLVQQINERRT